jgi:MFS family permease
MLSPGFVEISGQLGISVNTLSQATAWLILTIGLCLFIANPLSKMYGKRPIYIVAIVIMFAGSIWGAAAKNYSSFLGSRIFSGFGMAPYEVLVQCTIADLYFVHERATRIAVWNLFLLTGIAGGSLISGYIIQNLGYQWTFWICAIVFGICVLGIIFLVPETSYRRNGTGRIPYYLQQKLKAKADDKEKNMGHVSEVNSAPIPHKMSYMQSLRVYTGRYTRAPFWRIFVRPFIVFFYPAVLWAFLIYGTTLTWIVVFSVVNASIFTVPPYNFSVSETGLVSLSPFILTIIGELVSGPLNDYICLKLTEHNKGIYEPEFRLVLIIPVTLLGACGFFGFGASVGAHTHWAGPVLTFGIANMALAFASGCVFGYVIDAHENLAEEAFVAINARNFLTFGLTYFVVDWLAADGAAKVFYILGSLFLFVCALTIPLWLFGKRARGAIARNQFLSKFMADLE